MENFEREPVRQPQPPRDEIGEAVKTFQKTQQEAERVLNDVVGEGFGVLMEKVNKKAELEKQQAELTAMEQANRKKDADALAALRSEHADLLHPATRGLTAQEAQEAYKQQVELARSIQQAHEATKRKEQSATDRYGEYVTDVMTRGSENNSIETIEQPEQSTEPMEATDPAPETSTQEATSAGSETTSEPSATPTPDEKPGQPEPAS